MFPTSFSRTTRKDYDLDSPTLLAREFNSRYAGNQVTADAAREWLVGNAIPTQDTLDALASWLGVSTQWLLVGDDGTPARAER